MAQRMVAFLRGINVGGKHKVPMKTLCALFEKLGCSDVEHYIQSGNIVFTPPKGVTRAGEGKLAEQLMAAFAKQLKFEAPIVLRTAKELVAIGEKNPYAGFDKAKTAVMLLAHEPTAARLEKLDPERSPGDEYVVHGREIYCKCPNGFARTKLTNDYFDRTLETMATGRNLATIEKLTAMALG